MDGKKRKFQSIHKIYDENDDDQREKLYKFKVFLPNQLTVLVTCTKTNPENDEGISVDDFVKKVRKEWCKLLRETDDFKRRRKVFWDSKELYLEDVKGNKFRSCISFDRFKPNKMHFLKLFDGSGQTSDTFENMWDLTPDTDLLTELPDDYKFETALADLIDNSLQAVWSNGRGERKLISVEVYEDEVSVIDTGPGMDGSDENSIEKWGKMGASAHRSFKKLAIGGNPPYLKPFFGMFGYGGTIASMHLGSHAMVFAKTKESKKVYWLRLDREALLKRSGSGQSWKAAGGMRDPSDSEIKMSPHGSFTKIVMKPKLKLPDVHQLQCKLKDIYFPYIQCDEISKTGRTKTLVDFEINGVNLAEIEGGEVAVSNLHSCNGLNFVVNLHFSFEEDKDMPKSPSSSAACEGNARLKCVYFPIIEGKENIEKILENLNADGLDIKEDYETYSRISIRRLGRLLPEARWELLPFMKPKQKRGAKVEILRRCCMRVKCFIDTDAGFNPIPSKTDLAPQHAFTKALKDLGDDTKERAVKVQIERGGKQLSLQQLVREYQDWILQMHGQYDDECNSGDDESVWLINPSNKEALGITSNAVRVHQAVTRKGKSWNRGQKVKIFKGACPGLHRNNVYATIEYFLLEGLQNDAGGEARVVCRPLGIRDEDGSVLTVDDSIANLELRKSKSLPITVIDSGKCTAVDDNEWNCQIDKQNLKMPSSIEVLGPKQCKTLDIDGALPTGASVSAGSSPPKEVVAILRPSNFITSCTTNDLDQKYILRDNYEMCLDINFETEAGKGLKFDPLIVKSTSHKGYQGLYIFSVGSIPNLFQKAGVYSFSFSLKNSTTASCEQIVRVTASSKVKRWELVKGNDQTHPLRVSVGSCFPPLSICRYDEFDNIIPFKSKQLVDCQLMSNETLISHLKNVKVELSSDMCRMTVMSATIKTDKLDTIRPSYEATLALCQPDKQPFLSIPCQVVPGPLHRVRFSSGIGEGLHPQQVVEDFKLEMFDRYQNRVEQGIEVELDVHGFSFQDKNGLKRKVDNDGCIDLSGLLKVTEGYGKPVSLSVNYNENNIFNKTFRVVKRELRIATVVPEVCPAGTKLKDVAFEVVNSKGDVDQTIDDEVKSGKSHTLRLMIDLASDNSLRYAFRKGRCIIPSISLPQSEGRYCIEAVHSVHRELHVKLEVTLSKSTHVEHDTTSDYQGTEEFDCDASQYSDDRISSHSISDAATNLKTKGFEFQNSKVTALVSEEECDTLSSLQTPKADQEKSSPATFSESNLQKQQALPQSLLKQSDSKYEHNKDIFKTPERKIICADSYMPEQAKTLLGSEFEATLAQCSIKQSDSEYEHNNDIFKTPERKIICADSYMPEQAKTLMGSEFESAEKEIHYYGLCIKKQEDELKYYSVHKKVITEELRHLNAELEVLQQPLSQSDYMSQKKVLLEKVESKVDSAAAIYSIASQDMALMNQHPEFMADVAGLVALLATAPSLKLSRSLAEYLGEEQMLGIVCQSSAAIETPNSYVTVLNSLGRKMGRTFKGRQLFLCLDDIRAYSGKVLENDHQRRLDMPNPTLPDGSTPPGFLGFAVNMINIDINHTHVWTEAGHGLRETLFYHLFGDLQVYETKEQMNCALGCITDGAISLDGGIMRRKGTVLLGSMLVDVHFPVLALGKVSSDREQHILEEKKKKESDLSLAVQAIAYYEEELRSSHSTFREKEAGYLRLIEDKESMQKLNLSQQSLQTTPTAPAPTQSPRQ